MLGDLGRVVVVGLGGGLFFNDDIKVECKRCMDGYGVMTPV